MDDLTTNQVVEGFDAYARLRDKRIARRCAESERIEEMAPGTQFTAATNSGTRHSFRIVEFDGVALAYLQDGYPDGSLIRPSDINPSTIRDVTPPKDAA